MRENQSFNHDKILAESTTLLKSIKRFENTQITKKTHFDRDLKMTESEFLEFSRKLELHFDIQLTRNNMTFLRELGSLVFYIESMLSEKNR